MDETHVQSECSEDRVERVHESLTEPYGQRGSANTDPDRKSQNCVTFDVSVSSRNGDVLGAMLFVPADKLESLGYELDGLKSVSLSVVASV